MPIFFRSRSGLILLSSLVLAFSMSNCVVRDRPGNIDLLMRYDPEPPFIYRARLHALGDSIVVAIEVEYDSVRWNQPPNEFVEVAIKFYENYRTKSSFYFDSVPLSSSWKRIDNMYHTERKLATPAMEDFVAVVDFFLKDNHNRYVLLLDYSDEVNYVSLPTASGNRTTVPYLQKGNRYFVDQEKELSIVKVHFPHAEAPNQLFDKREPKVLEEHKMTIPKGSLFSPNKVGWVYTLSDSSKQQSSYLAPIFYPYPANQDENLESLHHLTNTSLRDTLFSYEDKRESFQHFWRAIGGSEAYSSELIHFWYGRMETANRLFTTVKPGWNTDRGLCYMVLGPPSHVYKTDSREIWYYEKGRNLKEVEFTFLKEAPIFGIIEYNVLQKNTYDALWFEALDLWRNGTPPR